MENMEMNEIITTEAAKETMEAVASGKSGVKPCLVIGGTVAGIILLWEGVMRPVTCKVVAKIEQKLAKTKKAEAVDLDDMELEDIPDIE